MSVSSFQGDTRQCGHLCLPFETEDERREAVLEFLHEGLSRGARCLVVGDPQEYEDLCRGLEDWGICSKRAVARGALMLKSDEEIYLRNGSFDPTAPLEYYDAAIDDALAAGFTGVRATAELTYVPDEADWRKLVWYEAQVNDHFARRPFSGLCRYPRAVVPPERVQDVLRTHPIAIVRGELCDNPFYERPDLALSDDNRTRLDWQLRQLRVGNRARKHLEDKTVSAVAAAAELSIELSHLRAREGSQKD
jgi:hypothetical protein